MCLGVGSGERAGYLLPTFYSCEDHGALECPRTSLLEPDGEARRAGAIREACNGGGVGSLLTRSQGGS